MHKKLRLPEWKAFCSKLGKYKYVILLSLVGVILLLWPSSQDTKAQPVSNVPEQSGEESLESALEAALARIEGAGETTLVLSWKDDGEVIYQTDEAISESDGASTSDSSTVIVQTGSSHYEALVVQNRSPTCLGALVVCEGADSAVVRLEIINAVAALTGLSSDRISVVKMNS